MYERLEGRWRDLLNRLKWDTIKSAVKSVAGLQGRKFKARPPASVPPVPRDCVSFPVLGLDAGHPVCASLRLT